MLRAVGLALVLAVAVEASTPAAIAQLKTAKEECWKLCDEKNCNPVLVRLAWHDSGTHDCSIKEWPKCGGAIGSIRFQPEIDHGANAGLAGAIKLLDPIKEKCPLVSYADLFQMASATAIEHAGGPKIPMKYGRIDATGPEHCSPEGNLPDAEPCPKKGTYGCESGTQTTLDKTAAGHLRKVFNKMGLDDKEIVALSGAHTLGRAWKDRSGLGKDVTKFTDGKTVVRADGKEGCGNPGGSSWTQQWLKFDNSYFKIVKDEGADPELLKLSTDKEIFKDEKFKPFAEKYAEDEQAFFADYAEAHAKLSELGSKFEPADGVKIE